MNIFLWILQIILALHTVTGAVWKFSNSEQTMSSLSAIPHEVWLAMSVFEILFSLCLVLPLFNKLFLFLAPIAATCITVEMLFFSGLHIYSGDSNYGPVTYWLVVAAFSAFIAYSRNVINKKSKIG